MYKNPLTDGDFSDYNSLKNQQNYGAITKEYQSRNLKTQPTELQKYYEYLTYQQPTLDEINYIAEKMKTEDIEKQKKDFEFLENLKEQRENKMKEVVNINKPKNELFYEPEPFNLKMSDLTPYIQTDNELQFDIIDKNFIKKEYGDIIDIDIGKSLKNKGLLLNDKSSKEKFDEAINKYGISTDLSNTMNRPIIKLEPKKTTKQINNDFFVNIAKNLPIRSDLQTSTIASQADTMVNIPRNKRKSKGGRPKGSKNTPKRTLNL
jgi:hypothetical protein